ncbi:MAG: hypothetical protein AAGF84_14070 [Planctomycetota bacterium]
MFIYAGIDEAGYGPFFGPMTVGRCVLRIPKLDHDVTPPDLWARLNKAVCRRLSGRKGRLVVNDSKKLTTKAAGIKHLELGVLSFTVLSGKRPQDVGQWLDQVGETRHRAPGSHRDENLSGLPWYEATGDSPWQALPGTNTVDELTLASGMLKRACKDAGVHFERFSTQVIYEDEFNHKVGLTRSKASVSFTAVASHLVKLMEEFGEHHPHVAVDRQSGRTRYRDLLGQVFESADINVLAEGAKASVYEVVAGKRKMFISFLVEAEQQHMPVALASMNAKLTRELLMQRFNAYFQTIAPEVKPTAGYGSDANRWRDDILVHLQQAGVDHGKLRRLS